MLLKNKVVMLAAVEDTYGVLPDAGDFSGLLANDDIDYKPVGDKLTRNIIQQSFSPAGHVIGVKLQQLNHSVEGKGGGLDEGDLVPPEFDPLLQACALVRTSVVRLTVASVAGAFEVGEVVTGGTSAATGTLRRLAGADVLVLAEVAGTFQDAEQVTGGTSAATANVSGGPVDALEYAPTSDRDSMASAALKFYWDTHLHILRGVRGDLKVVLETGKYPSFAFTLQGLWTDPADEADPPTPTVLDLVPPVVKAAGLKVGTFAAPVAEKLELSLGNSVTRRPDMNADEGLRELAITGRAPSGSIDPEVEALATFNPYASWKAAGENRIVAAVGSAAGNRIMIEVPKAVLDEINQGEREGTRTYALPFTAKGLDDDELYISFF